MGYSVKITDSALVDAEEYIRFIRLDKREPEAAERWWQGLVSAILSLEEMPSRYVLIPEAKQFAVELRHLIFHSHRIVYHINENKRIVTVLRIYHGFRRRLRTKDLTIDDL